MQAHMASLNLVIIVCGNDILPLLMAQHALPMSRGAHILRGF